MDINRVQGLIDLYRKAGKSRPAVLTQADYYLRHKLIAQEDVDALLAALDEQDARQERIDIRGLITEREALRGEKADLEAENAALEAEIAALKEAKGGGEKPEAKEG